MMELFHGLATPQEKQLAAKVEELGGEFVVVEDEQVMETLAEEEFLLVEPDPESRRDRGVLFDFAELRKEIKANPEEAIEKNAESFNSKFEIQREQIVTEITRALSQEGSRIISAAEAGPHDRVIDPVWHEFLAFAQPIPYPLPLGYA